MPDLTLTAYRIGPGTAPALEPAPRRRAWSDATSGGFANRCLPLLMANQAGWVIRSAHRLTAVWHGTDDPDGLRVSFSEGLRPYPAESHFGHGVLTFRIPYLFRTPPGYNLLARGPANSPKDGACALEGLVETDWAVAPFTFNWKLTRPGLPVTFEVGEPICMIVPQRRGELEEFVPSVCDLDDAPALAEQVAAFGSGRAAFLRGLQRPSAVPSPHAWEKHYFHGRRRDGVVSPEHQRKLALRRFAPVPALQAAGTSSPNSTTGDHDGRT